ncbi:MAG: (d)CMP kinase [Pseudomonadota bacterium]
MATPPVIAVDGPAASGKGTLSRRIAETYGFAYLDTGSLYRGVAWSLLVAGRDPESDADAAAAAADLDAAAIDGDAIRTDAVGVAASRVAAKPAVRAALLEYQRRFAASPPGGAKGSVLDGRDIGTVVCPEATVKLFVSAAPEVRARRRWLELRAEDPDLAEETVLADIRARDARDAGRADAPMRPAADAVLIDTSSMTIDQAFAAARAAIDPALTSADD